MRTKKLLTILTLLLTTQINAEETSFTRIIKDETHSSQIILDLESVRCSGLGYGLEELKISVPSLKWSAIFDHSNNDNRGPCVTAGTRFCSFLDPEGIPDVLLDPENPRENIQVRVFLEERFDKKENHCTRTLEEKVETNVRGIDFTHSRIKDIGTIDLEECNRLF
ncbi:hypothetical protein [Halobacteriovorax sp. HLS]|uniref:hypothetical protein n=1 Tax=Halobacteriovorax sp. HLS TaxID=2234000 RepID=UPI000FD80072|nr:hypothetical protein [Halobacteriovorax sp. HLS]